MNDYEPGERYLPQYTRIVYDWRRCKYVIATMQDLGGKHILRTDATEREPEPVTLEGMAHHLLNKRNEPMTCRDIARALEVTASAVRRTLEKMPDVFCVLGMGGYDGRVKRYGLTAWTKPKQRREAS